MNIQEQLLFLTNRRVEMRTPNIRGVTACWKGDVACISFYFYDEI